MLNSGSGLLLVTGPVGAGKSTTLYACLEALNDGKKMIITLEDPIERVIKGLRSADSAENWHRFSRIVARCVAQARMSS